MRRWKELLRRSGGRPAWTPFLARFWPFILGSALVAGGLAAIVLGYYGASGTLHVGLQMPYLLSGGLLGLALVLFGCALLVVHALNRQARLLERLLAQRSAPAPPPPAEPANGLVVVPPGASMFHRPSCSLVEGKTARRLKIATARRRGLAACPLCDPVVAS